MQLDCDLTKCNPQFAQCIYTVIGVICQCKRGFLDADPQKPGTKCIQSRGMFIFM